jgi:hypothetical protein
MIFKAKDLIKIYSLLNYQLSIHKTIPMARYDNRKYKACSLELNACDNNLL